MTGYKSFSDFAATEVNVDYLKQECLTAEGRLKKELMKGQPEKFWFYQIEYDNAFMAADEAKALKINNSMF